MTGDATLTQTQKNQVYSDIRRHNLDHAEFNWSEEEVSEGQFLGDWRVTLLKHVPTGYYFRFGYHLVTFSPSWDFKVETFSVQNISDKLNCLDRWLRMLHAEYTAPDLWATVSQEKALSRAVSSSHIANVRFTPAEQKLIAAKIDDIMAYLVAAQTYNEEQFETIHRVGAYLKDASIHYGRKDWLTILLGGLVGLALTLAVPPETAKGMMKLAGEVFQWLWAEMPLLGH